MTKNFKEICQLPEAGLKIYMHNILKTYGYEPVSESGFLYAKGSFPVLLVAHLDTVHTQLPTVINEDKNGWLSSPQGIGGDDRCGVFMIQEIIKSFHCSVLLCEQEEAGMIGASKFADSKYAEKLDVNYMIELDRKGKNDAVFYDCSNDEFTKFIEKNTGYKSDWGSFTDICEIMPVSGIAGVNLSCGYYSAHTKSEYVKPQEMMNTVSVVKKLLAVPTDKPFEYVEKKRSFYGSDDWYKQYLSKYSPKYTNSKKGKQQSMVPYEELEVDENSYTASKNKRKKKPTELTLVVYVEDYYSGMDEEIIATGKTTDECWANFFFENPDYSYSMVYNYYWM